MKSFTKSKKVDSTGRQHMRDSQIEYRLQLRAQKYSFFPHPIHYKGRLFYIKDFCKHGDLLINPSFFDFVYYKNDNIHELYCDKCREEYIQSKITERDVTESRNTLKEIYPFSSKLKENHIKYNYFILYECIKNNCKENIPWLEKTFLFKEGLAERPKCAEDGCHEHTFFSKSNRRYTYFCDKHMGGFKSKVEIELFDFIKSLNPNVKKFRLNNGAGSYIELDTYLPDKKLAFEFNGLYWHNELYKTKDYHYNKWKACKDNGIQLINIWQDDWQFKLEIVKSIIRNKLNVNQKKIYARNCEIKIVDSQQSKIFLEQNHLYGNCSSSIKIGLYYEGELVSLMTFGKRNIGKATQFELIRFCSKLNTNVIGSASKLFQYFLKHYKFNKLISYANCDISNGHLYETLNFKEIGHTGINYWWSDNVNKYHRMNFMKHKIGRGKETESEIMGKRNFYKIFGTGNLKYEYIN